MNFYLSIITPEKEVYKDEVSEVVAPTIDGEIAILPNHINLLTQIKPGELIVKKGSDYQSIAITGGFLEVNDNKVSILAPYAIKAQDIQVARATEAKERAEKIMKEKATDKDFKIAQGELFKSLLELKIAGKHRRRY